MTTRTETVGTTPITTEWKISDVLRYDPKLLDVLIEATPAFKKLRNPVLRRIQSKLVTVGQAAQIAGLEPSYLVARLNTAAGIEIGDVDTLVSDDQPAQAPEPPWVATATVAEALDVRTYHQGGREPFGAIMEASRKVPPGQVLFLRNTFEPTPLYDVLGPRGFEPWARQITEDDWEIRFFNSGSSHTARRTETKPAANTTPDDWDEPTATLTIDVSELVPPEPMIRILTALEGLPDGATLLVHHVRRPMHLYPRLDELGYRHETRELGPNRVEVLIEKATAEQPI
ncbi:MAG: DUF2249 domain-containing protein [Thermomicrobiales bacterium]|nr:DUF2249 domain-containing protein [Thermomicrobiales bacterium]MCO5222568.1 DUF2249 domain-containing protein [Thermomicrobiales bacterium]